MATAIIPMNPACVTRIDGNDLYTEPMYILGIAGPNIAYGAGQFLRRNTSNQLVACATSAASTATSGGIQFQSQQAAKLGASGTNTVTDVVMRIESSMRFLGNVIAGQTLADTDCGTQCGISVTAASNVGSVVTLDKNNANVCVEITGVGYVFDPSQYNSTDTGAVCYFKVLSAAIDAAPAA
jgi:hypothetical protein